MYIYVQIVILVCAFAIRDLEKASCYVVVNQTKTVENATHMGIGLKN